MRKGIGVSPGVAVGTAYCIHEIFVNPNTRRLADAEVRPELAKYEQAREATAADLRALHAKVASQVGAEQAAIFLRTNRFCTTRPSRQKFGIGSSTSGNRPAPRCTTCCRNTPNCFRNTKDEYIKERLADVRDVIVG